MRTRAIVLGLTVVLTGCAQSLTPPKSYPDGVGDDEVPRLLVAIEIQDYPGVVDLLDSGVSPNQNSGGYTALMDAAARPDGRIVEELLGRGANVTLGDDSGYSVLIAAARGEATLPTVNKLIAAGADPCVRSSDLKIAGHDLTRKRAAEIAKIFNPKIAPTLQQLEHARCD